MEVERSIWLRKKTNKLQVHPYKPVSWLPTQSSDEWATTKQACKDELVVYLSVFLAIYIQLCIQCALPVVTIMALWQLLNLGTGCTVTGISR